MSEVEKIFEDLRQAVIAATPRELLPCFNHIRRYFVSVILLYYGLPDHQIILPFNPSTSNADTKRMVYSLLPRISIYRNSDGVGLNLLCLLC